MSIKPVEFQVMIPKTSEVSKINQDEKHKSHIIQQEQNLDIKNKTQSDLRQVNKKEKVNNMTVEDSLKKDQEKKKKDKKDKKNPNDPNDSNDIYSSKIDIRI